MLLKGGIRLAEDEPERFRWECEWKWLYKELLPQLNHPTVFQSALDKIPKEDVELFNKEIKGWIEAGFPVPCERSSFKGIIALMAIQQHGKTTRIKL